MLLDIVLSTILFLLFLLFGNLMMFIDVFAFWLVLPYVIILVLLYRTYHENCKTMEVKDFIFTLGIVMIDLLIYSMFESTFNWDIFSFLYLATFVPFLSFATTIRFKSLM